MKTSQFVLPLGYIAVAFFTFDASNGFANAQEAVNAPLGVQEVLDIPSGAQGVAPAPASAPVPEAGKGRANRGLGSLLGSLVPGNLVSNLVGSLTPGMLSGFVDKYVGTPETVEPGYIQKTIYEIGKKIGSTDPQTIKDDMYEFSETASESAIGMVMQGLEAAIEVVSSLDPTVLSGHIVKLGPIVAKVSPAKLREDVAVAARILNSPQSKSMVELVQSKINKNKNVINFDLAGIVKTVSEYVTSISAKKDQDMAAEITKLSNSISGLTPKEIGDFINSGIKALESITEKDVTDVTTNLSKHILSITNEQVASLQKQISTTIIGISPKMIESLTVSIADMAGKQKLSNIRSIFVILKDNIDSVKPETVKKCLGYLSTSVESQSPANIVLGLKTMSVSVTKASDEILSEVVAKILKVLVVMGKAVQA
ncbi:hypothetical protein BB561_006805 [Smittium simulii]|uniref:Uncharacterized protein n=1 Tax=Smittium simulii TaxID=133385 RepID=A0A2T9Y1E4_9FUNG|nr:hypothetical protein BB561_006805 [Smittium simulii]